MLKTVEDVSSTRKRITIEIPSDAIEREIRESLEKVRKTASIPGFRAGKAPMDMIERRFGKKVQEDVLDRLIPQVYVDALKEAEITPISDPVLEHAIDFKRNQPLSMTLTVETMPKIEDLKYEGIAVRAFPVTVDDSEVEGVLKRMQEEKATFEPSDGPVEMSDLVVLDYITAEGDVTATDQMFKVGGSLFPAEVSLQLTGKKKGETLKIETEFPSDALPEKLAGRKAALTITIKDIKKISLPALDDELAKDVGFETLDSMKSRVGEQILAAKGNEVSRIQKAEIMTKLLDSHTVDLPESMLDLEEKRLAALEKMKKPETLEQTEGTTTGSEPEQDVKLRAEMNVKASLLLGAIGRKEQVSVSEDEMKKAVLSLAGRLGVAPENLVKFYVSRDGSLEGLRNSLFEDKVLDLILAKAVFEKGE